VAKLERLRRQYGLPITRGGRIKRIWFGQEREGTIVGATTFGSLRIHFDGTPKEEVHFVHPTVGVTYLDKEER
jgi:hypothetical protein